MLNMLSPLFLLFAAVPHVFATLLGRYLLVRHHRPSFRALKIDGETWRVLGWKRRAGTFLLPLAVDVVFVGLLLIITGFMVPTTAEESFVEPLRDGPAERAGLLSGDRVVRIEDRNVSTFVEMRDAVTGTNKPVLTIVALRGDRPHTFQVERQVQYERALIGVRPMQRSATLSDALAYAVEVPRSMVHMLSLLFDDSPNVVIGAPRAIVEVVAEAPATDRAAVVMVTISSISVFTWWMVLVFCAIGTPWRTVFSRGNSTTPKPSS